jgi:Proprotein convertase P-domain/Somatomedin B domain
MNMMTKLSILLAFALTLGACGELNDRGAEADRGLAQPRSLGKADGASSCKGYCGKQAPAGCWCDSQCVTFGDCCKDKKPICDAPKPDPKPSCTGFCGKQSPDGCWCDSQCATYGDCCKDKQQTCDTPPPPSPSCQGFCGKQAPSGCWCNKVCAIYGDCCADKQQVCDTPKPGQDCSASSQCGGSMKCFGIPGDGSGPFGKCNSSAAISGEGASCSATQPCKANLVCAGQEIWTEGNCVPTWMKGSYENASAQSIPLGIGGVTSSVVVYGLATVPVDIAVDLKITHPRPSDLTITLTDPNGAVSTVWKQASTLGPDLNQRLLVKDNSRDDMVNGRWTLKVVDGKTGASGTLKKWTLELTSRWD